MGYRVLVMKKKQFNRKFLWWYRNTLKMTSPAYRTALYRNLKISIHKNFLHIEQKI